MEAEADDWEAELEAEIAARAAAESAEYAERRWRMDEWEKRLWLDISASGLVFTKSKQEVRKDIFAILLKLECETMKEFHTIDQIENKEYYNDLKKRIFKLCDMMMQVKRDSDADEVTREISLMVYMKEMMEDKGKKAKAYIPKRVKGDVWNTYIGANIIMHRCLCCKKTVISNTEFEVGHVISESSGGTLEIGNLRPVCTACNHSMGSSNMVDFVKKYGYYIG